MTQTLNLFSAIKYIGASVEGETDFTIPFPYLRKQDVYVFLTEEPILPEDEPIVTLLNRPAGWDFNTTSGVRLVDPLPVGHSVTIRRFTRKDQRLADFFDGSTLTEQELNDVTKQLLYLIQEIDDFQRIGAESGVNIPGDDDVPTDTIEALLDALYETPIFQTLVELIEFVDINAESVIRNALAVHENWRREEFRTIEVGARFTETLTLIEEGDTALAEATSLLSARVDDTEAFVGEFQSAFSGPDSAVATLVTELGARLRTDEFETVVAESSYVNAIEASVSTNSAELVILESGLTQVEDNLVIAQTLINQNATDLFAQGSIFTQLGAITGFTGDPFNEAAAFAASIQEAWQVYTDEESALAERTQTLEVNTKPVLFDQFVPQVDDPFGPGYRGDDFPSGFPNNTQWYRQWIYSGSWRMLTYTFLRGTTNLNRIEGIDANDPEPYAYVINGVAGLGSGEGIWVSEEAAGLGALIQDSQSVSIGPDSAAAQLSTLVQTVVGESISAIEQTVESVIGEDGFIDNQWAVRMNTTLGDSAPVIAGFGLGLQTNPDTGASRSDFAIIADYFSLTATPNPSDPVGGSLAGNSFITPFLVDTANQNVYINGDLFVSDNLHAYEGRMRQVMAGRVVCGQMLGDPNAIEPGWNTLVDPFGFRIEMLSSTDNFWAADEPGGRNYLLWAGVGPKTDNSAVFWLDSNGNAYFGGTVLAQGIQGSLSNVKEEIENFAPSWLPVTTSWQVMGPEKSYTFQSLRNLTPVLQAWVTFTNEGARDGDYGQVEIQARWEVTPGSQNFTTWQTLDDTGLSLARDNSVERTSLFGRIPDTVGGEIRYRIRARVPSPSTTPISCANWRSLVMGLPTT